MSIPKCPQSHKLHDSLNNTRFANLTQINDINANRYKKYKHLHHIMYVITNVGLGYMSNSSINLIINMNMKILNQLGPIYSKNCNWNCVFVVCKKYFFKSYHIWLVVSLHLPLFVFICIFLITLWPLYVNFIHSITWWKLTTLQLKATLLMLCYKFWAWNFEH